MTKVKCEPCNSSMPKLPADKCREYLRDLPDWQLNEEVTEVSRRFVFKNFSQALDFANKVGELAEEMGHHPVITIGWGFCLVNFKTAKIGGLHQNDFIMAGYVNKLST